MANPSPTRPFFDVRQRGFPTRTPVDEVLALIRDRTSALPSESVEVASAIGRVLSNEVIAPISVPHFDRAAFDGYAVRASATFGASRDHPITLRIVGESMPGRPANVSVEPGEAIRIVTGSPMPSGADAVVPFEFSEEFEGAVRIFEATTPGKNVGRTGEDVSAGRMVLNAGRRLRPQDLGLLSSIGVSRVQCVRRPRVAILVTGDEILPPGSIPNGHQIVDSNSVTLRALAERDGAFVPPTIHLPDRPEMIRAAIASTDWDVLLVSGGTSVGREDHAPRLVAELGELPVHGVAIRPASPAGVGFVAGKSVFLLPGNPVACLCAYDLFAGLAVRRLGGRPDTLPYRVVEHPVGTNIAAVEGRLDYVRVRLGPNGVEPVPGRGASILSSTVTADGFVLIPPESGGLTAGERVGVHLYDG